MPIRYALPFGPCKDLDLNLEAVNYSPVELESSVCANLSEDLGFGGSYSKQEIVRVLDLLVLPCVPVNPGDCEILYNGVPTSTVTSADIASEYFRDYKMELSFLESTHDVKNYESSLKRNIRKFELKFNSKKVNLQTYKLSVIKTTSTTGTFSRQNKTEEGVFFQTQIDAFQSKSPTDYLVWMYEGAPAPPHQFPYGLV